MRSIGFRYHPEILSKFPNICGGVIVIHDIVNQPSPAALLETYFADQERINAALGDAPLSEIPSLAAWRSAFRQFGVDPTRYRSAAEALLRRLTKKGDIPSISTLVDICNLVSIRNALPVAAFDARQLSGSITVQFASGEETFTAHDTPEPEHPLSGEVIFADPAGMVVARRWCWKQSAESTVGLDTAAAVITIESQNPNSENQITDAISDLSLLLSEHMGIAGRNAVLGSSRDSFSIEIE